MRVSLAGFLLAQAVALGAATHLQAPVDSYWKTEVPVAAALNVLMALGLIAFPRRVLSDRIAAGSAGMALALATSAGILATGGSAGPFNLALPVAAFLAAVMFPWRAASTIAAALVATELFSTVPHAGVELSFSSGYQTVVTLLVTGVILAGTVALKEFFLRNARTLGEKNRELDGRVRELAAVGALARSVGAATDRDSVLLQGLLMALEATACDSGILFLEEEKGCLRPHHWVGLSDDAAIELCRQACDDDFAGPARWRSGESTMLVIPDLRAWRRADDVGLSPMQKSSASPRGLQGSMAAVPLTIQTGLLGALAVIDSGGLVMGERGMRVLEAVAAEIALAVDRQHYVDEGSRQRRQLETLHGIARKVTASLKTEEVLEFAVTEATKLVDADVAFVATLAEVTGSLRIVAEHGRVCENLLGFEMKKGCGVGGHVVAERGIFQTEDYCADPRLENDFGDLTRAEGLRTVIGLPLVNRDRVKGVLYVARRRALRFCVEEIEILEMLSSHIAVALENANLYEDVYKKSTEDPLTGVFNRRQFERCLRDEERRAVRHGRSVSLLMMDVDDFKRHNDAHGHIKGDELLKTLAVAIAGAVRSGDVLARYGGEEFVVLLPETDLSTALDVGERVREAVKERFALDGVAAGAVPASGTITMSVGAATFCGEYSEGANLIERADAALYRAKRQGKDRVVADDAGEDIVGPRSVRVAQANLSGFR